jgi:hypothetical protein
VAAGGCWWGWWLLVGDAGPYRLPPDDAGPYRLPPLILNRIKIP